MDCLTPHYRDWFAGYRFAPGRVAVEHGGVWVADIRLPIFVYVDLGSGAPGEPISAQSQLGMQFETYAIASDAEHLYVRGQSGLSALHRDSGAVAWQRPEPCFDLMVRDGSVWTAIGADVAEIDRVGRVAHRYGFAGWNCRSCAPQRGSVAVLATPERRIMPIRVARFEAGVSRPSWTTELHGSAGGGWRNIYATEDVVWVIRQTPWPEGEIRRYLCALDAATGELLGELQVDLSGRIMLHNGIAWAWAQLADEDGRPLRRTVTAFDPRTGEVRARHDLGVGNAPWPDAGPSGIWCTVWDRAPFLLGLPPADAPLQRLPLEAIDASGFRPPPPPRITAKPVEQEALERIRTDIRLSPDGAKLPDESDPGPFGPDIHVQAAALEGQFPDTRIVVYFRSLSLPGRLFARSTRLWNDSGTFENDYYLHVTVNLEETLHACSGGLPATRTPDNTGVVWI